MNPRYEAYLKTTDNPKNWEFINFISDMVVKYGEENNLKREIGGYRIDNQDKFSAFIQQEVECDNKTEKNYRNDKRNNRFLEA